MHVFLYEEFEQNGTDVLKRIENIDDDRLKFLGILPYDEEISTLNLTGDNLLKLSNENALYKSAKSLFESIV